MNALLRYPCQRPKNRAVSISCHAPLINNHLYHFQYDSIAKDKGFLRVLSKLKSKYPAIYDK